MSLQILCGAAVQVTDEVRSINQSIKFVSVFLIILHSMKLTSVELTTLHTTGEPPTTHTGARAEGT